jgi:signal transduction histidine kinase
MMDVMSGPGNARAEPVWIRTITGWHVAFWLFLAMMLVLTLLVDLPVRDRLGFAGLLVVLGLAYLLLGQPAARSRDRLQSHAYRLILVACCGVATAFYPQSSFLLFIAFPQIWVLSERVREGAQFSVLLLLGNTVGMLYAANWSWEEFRPAFPWLLVSLTMSLLLGIWIERVIDQSEQRAALIAELDSTRGELAEAHHAAGVMAERERMAREIHDTLAQGMTSIVMLAQAAQAEQAKGRGTAAKLVAIEDTARENLSEARALVAAFTPVALAESTLTEVLRRQAERFTAETGVRVEVELDLPDDEVAACRPRSRWCCCEPRRRRWRTSASTRPRARCGSGWVPVTTRSRSRSATTGKGSSRPRPAPGTGSARCADGSRTPAAGSRWRAHRVTAPGYM